MKKLIYTIFSIVILILYSDISLACLPNNESNIIIGKYNGIYSADKPKGTWGENQIYLELNGAFKLFTGENIYKNFNNNNLLDLKLFKKGDILILISDYQDGSFPNYYTTFGIGKIINKNGKISIVDKKGDLKDWNYLLKCGKNKEFEIEVLEKLNTNFSGINEINNKIIYNTYTYNIVKNSFYFIILFLIIILIIFLRKRIFKKKKE